MNIVLGSLSVAAFIANTYLLVRLVRPAHLAETCLSAYILFCAQVVLCGYLLSEVNQLASSAVWLASSIVILALVLVVCLGIPRFRQLAFRQVQLPNWRGWIVWFMELSGFEKSILLLLLVTVLGIGEINLVQVIFLAPFNWDSMTFYIARVAYYLQNGNLHYYDANYWAQVVHPKVAPTLMLYTFIASGRNENMMQLSQYIAYWVATISIYGISRRVGYSKQGSLFAALIFALLTIVLMEAITTQSDLLLTALIGCLVYFWFAYNETRIYTYLYLAGIALGLATGVKGTVFLIYPVLAFIGTYIFLWKPLRARQTVLPGLGMIALTSILGISVFALPSGYWENFHLYGHPLGPEFVRKMHSYESQTAGYILSNGTKNLLRYSIEFLSFDGLPPIKPVRVAQHALRSIPAILCSHLGLDLESNEEVRVPFIFMTEPVAHEDASSWGLLGFGLVWVTVIMQLFGRGRAIAFRILSSAAVLLLIAHAYSSFYDPWRGRYFLSIAIFAVPAVGGYISQQKRIGQFYLLLIVLLGCLSGWTGVLLRKDSAVVDYKFEPYSVVSAFEPDRLAQITRARRLYYQPFKTYEQIVPADATVAVLEELPFFEYPLFGEHLTRTIIPLNTFQNGIQPIPENADFLLFSKSLIAPTPDDVFLGKVVNGEWYLRRLIDSP